MTSSTRSASGPSRPPDHPRTPSYDYRGLRSTNGVFTTVAVPAAPADVHLHLRPDVGHVGRPQVREPDPLLQDRRERPARDLADQLIRLEHRVVGARDMAALLHQEAAEPARHPFVPLAKQRLSPPELALVERDRPAQPGLERGRGLEQVLTVERIAHLQTEHVARGETARHPPERRHRLGQRRPQVQCDVLIREQLESDLARVSRSGHDDRPPVVLGLGALHEREVARLREQLAHHVDGLRPLDGEEAPILVVHQVEAVVGSLLLEHPEHAGGVRRVRHDEVPLRLEAIDDQVLDHPAALVQHEVVERLTHGRVRQVVRDHAAGASRAHPGR